MEDSNIDFLCSECETRLKRQIMDSNIFYYCRKCGRMSSETYLLGEVSILRSQRPPVHAVTSTTELEISENSGNAIS
jgi:hypothetical protein